MAAELQCVIVTPERAVLDARADFVVIPLIDGELGVLPGHTPMVGRVGKGELRLKSGSDTRKLSIEGGFAQVRGNIITVLTSRVKLS